MRRTTLWQRVAKHVTTSSGAGIGIAVYDIVGVGDLWSAASGEEYITFQKLGPWERAMYGVSGAVKLGTTIFAGTRAVGAARGWRAGSCAWNPFSTCFVAGTQVHRPHDVRGTWYASGALTLAGAVVVAAVIAPKKKRTRRRVLCRSRSVILGIRGRRNARRQLTF